MGKVFESALSGLDIELLFKIKLFYFNINVFLNVCICTTYVPDAQGGWKKTLCSLARQLWIVMSQHVSGGN